MSGTLSDPRRRWRNRRTGRIAAVVRVRYALGHVVAVAYRYRAPVRTRPTMYTRPFVSTPERSLTWFRARFEEVRHAR